MATPPEWYKPDAPPLAIGSEEGNAAVAAMTSKFPSIVRQQVDPELPNQSWALTTIQPFSSPKTFAVGKDGARRTKPIMGLLKVRGVAPTEEAARALASKLVREVDSRNPIKIHRVGQYVPYTDEQLTTEIFEVDEANALHSVAAKEKAETERRMMREIREAERELREEGDVYDDKSSLRYYTMKRVTHTSLLSEIARLQSEVRKYQRLANITTNDLRRIEVEENHPEYAREWVKCYNDERSKTSLPLYIPDPDFIAAHEAAMAAPSVVIPCECSVGAGGECTCASAGASADGNGTSASTSTSTSIVDDGSDDKVE